MCEVRVSVLCLWLSRGGLPWSLMTSASLCTAKPGRAQGGGEGRSSCCALTLGSGRSPGHAVSSPSRKDEKAGALREDSGGREGAPVGPQGRLFSLGHGTPPPESSRGARRAGALLALSGL